MIKIEWIGKKFGKLTVLEKQDGYMFLCKCECGEIKSINGSGLLSGHKKSCGCLRKYKTKPHKTTHGLTGTTEYIIWGGIIARCTDPTHHAFSDYGERGIGICNKWRNSFTAFLKDMGKRPSRFHTIERKNNDKGYSKSNCKWATRKEQARNRRSSRIVEIKGVKKCLEEWCDIYKIKSKSVNSRVKRGQSYKDAITTPLKRIVKDGKWKIPE